jgi:hypothetical protein
MERALEGGIEGCGDALTPYVDDRAPNALAGAVHLAFAQHRPLILTPDAVWLTVVHGVAQHVSLYPQECRAKLVPHEGRERIVVVRDTFDWPAIVEDFRRMLGRLALVSRHLTADFSTTGPVERVAQSIALMDVLAPYYQYEVRIICGIPQIGLAGTPDDWKLLREKVWALPDLDFEWWLEPLRQVADQMARAARGLVDLLFWRRIYKVRDSTGAYDPQRSTGWIMRLFPYLFSPVTRTPSGRNPLFARTPVGVRLETLPPGLRDVPLNVEVLGAGREMALSAGVAGIAQSGIALKPSINWCVRPADPRVSRLLAAIQERALKMERASLELGRADDVIPAELLILYRHHDGGRLSVGRRAVTVRPFRRVERRVFDHKDAMIFADLEDGTRLAVSHSWGRTSG